MGKLTIYGSARSRTQRVLWTAHELGLEFEHVPVAIARRENPTATDYFAEGETHTAEFLARNPNGKIPVIDDEGTVLWESMAINLYLARKHDRGLWPATVSGEGICFQWSFWAMTEAEPPLFRYLLNAAFLPEVSRNAQVAQTAQAILNTLLGILDEALVRHPYLLGDAFCVADLNVASVLAWLKLFGFPFTGVPNAEDWLVRCMHRPAYARATATAS